MGGGGLMQIVAFGAQDVFLTGNSQITFFKHVFRRHTNFSLEATEQTFQSNSKNLGNRLVAVISRNGDLLHRMWLEVVLPTSLTAHNTVEVTTAGVTVPKLHAKYAAKLGHALLRSAEVEIGGSRIDKTYGRFSQLWHELTCRAEKKDGYERMTATSGSATQPTELKSTTAGRKMYIPINFFFSSGAAGSALPLIALQYHEVRITIELAEAKDILVGESIVVSGTEAEPVTTRAFYPGSALNNLSTLQMMENPRLYSDFIYLDTDERRRFSQQSHEYLVTQLQFTGTEVSSEISMTSSLAQTIRLSFNHPTKALYIVAEPSNMDNKHYTADTLYNGYVNPVGTGVVVPDDNCPFESIGLMLNGHERFSTRDGSYFSMVQPFQHHTAVPSNMSGIAMYSFSLAPEEFQPSGALNLSRIDNCSLRLVHKKAHESFGVHVRNVHVFAVSSNILRALSGMAGLAFSN